MQTFTVTKEELLNNNADIECLFNGNFKDFPNTITFKGVAVEEEKTFCGKMDCLITPHYHCSICGSINGKHSQQCNFRMQTTNPKPLTMEFHLADHAILLEMIHTLANHLGVYLQPTKDNSYKVKEVKDKPQEEKKCSSPNAHDFRCCCNKKDEFKEKCKHGKEKQWCTDCQGYSKDKP